MKITEIKVSRKNSPLTRPLRISLGTITHSTSIVAEVMTDEGLRGIGEGAASAFVTGETMEGAQAALKMLEEALLGVDPTDEQLHELAEKCSHFRKRTIGCVKKLDVDDMYRIYKNALG